MSVVADEAVLAALRAVPEGQRATVEGLRAEIGCGTAPLKRTLHRLRLQGKIVFGRLELSPSMREAAPAAPPTIAEQIKAEAADAATRRKRARSTGSVKRTLDKQAGDAWPRSAAEAVAAAALAEPHDAIAHVKRAWPGLWNRVIALGRDINCLPGAALFRAIEAGLDCMEEAE